VNDAVRASRDAYDVERVRQDFPILGEPLGSKDSDIVNMAALASFDIGGGRPGRVGDKFERAHAASRVGAQFSNDIRRTVKILDSVLHFRDPRAQASWSMDRWLPSCCAAHCRERAPRPVLIGGRLGIKTADPLPCGAAGTRPVTAGPRQQTRF